MQIDPAPHLVRRTVVPLLRTRLSPRPFALDPEWIKERWAKSRKHLGGPFSRFSWRFEVSRGLLLRSPVIPTLILAASAVVLFYVFNPPQWFKNENYAMTDQALALSLFWLVYIVIVGVGGTFLYLYMRRGTGPAGLVLAMAALFINALLADIVLPAASEKSAEALLKALPWSAVTLGQCVLMVAGALWLILIGFQDHFAESWHLSEFAALRMIDALVEPVQRQTVFSRLLRKSRKNLLPAIFALVAKVPRSTERHGTDRRRTLKARWKKHDTIRFRRIRAIEDVAAAMELGIPPRFSCGDPGTEQAIQDAREARARETRAMKLLLISPTPATDQEFCDRATTILHDLVAGRWPAISAGSGVVPPARALPFVRHAAIITIAIATILATHSLKDSSANSPASPLSPGYLKMLWIVPLTYLAVMIQAGLDPAATQRLNTMRYYGSP